MLLGVTLKATPQASHLAGLKLPTVSHCRHFCKGWFRSESTVGAESEHAWPCAHLAGSGMRIPAETDIRAPEAGRPTSRRHSLTVKIHCHPVGNPALGQRQLRHWMNEDFLGTLKAFRVPSVLVFIEDMSIEELPRLRCLGVTSAGDCLD